MYTPQGLHARVHAIARCNVNQVFHLISSLRYVVRLFGSMLEGHSGLWMVEGTKFATFSCKAVGASSESASASLATPSLLDVN